MKSWKQVMGELREGESVFYKDEPPDEISSFSDQLLTLCARSTLKGISRLCLLVYICANNNK